MVDILYEFNSEIEMSRKYLKSVHKEFQHEKKVGIIDVIKILSERAILDYIEKNEPEALQNNYSTEHKENIMKMTQNMIKKEGIAKKIYETLIVEVDEGTIGVRSSSPGLINLFDKDSDDNEIEDLYIFKSVLYNLCSSVENVFSKTLKDYYLNIDKSDEINKQSISLSELKELGSVQDAEELLIEKKVEGIFYKSFSQWYEEIVEKLKLRELKKESLISDELKHINDLFLIRNLYIHNEGIVNDKFRNKCIIYTDYQKGDKFDLNYSFLDENIERISNVVYFFIYEYYFSKYTNRDIAQENFNHLNSILIDKLETGPESIGKIYYSLSDNKNLPHSTKIMSLINYYIYLYHNGRDYEKELSENDFSAFELQFKMAKSILLNNDISYQYELIETFINDIDEDFFFMVYDWPLMKIAKNNDDSIKRLLKDKLMGIIEINNDVENSEEEYDIEHE